MATSDELLRALGQTPANQQIGKPTDRDKLQSAINAPAASSDFGERLARIQAELESSNLSTIDWTPPEGGWNRVMARDDDSGAIGKLFKTLARPVAFTASTAMEAADLVTGEGASLREWWDQFAGAEPIHWGDVREKHEGIYKYMIPFTFGLSALPAAFESAGFENYWQITFLVLGVVIIACNIGLMFVHEPRTNERKDSQAKTDKLIEGKLGSSNFATKTAAWITGTVFGPVMSFFKKNGFNIALAILGFVFLFKIGEAFLGRMSVIFYKEIGFTKSDIALYSKGLGWITTVIFTLLGGLFAIRSGVIKAMFISGILMASTNLLFSLLAWSGKSELLFAIAVIFDDMAAAFATVAFVAFISMLVDRTYTATQYALLASIGTAGRTTLAASSGALVDWLNGDWGIFFIITAVMVIPSLIFLYMIKDKLKLND